MKNRVRRSLFKGINENLKKQTQGVEDKRGVI